VVSSQSQPFRGSTINWTVETFRRRYDTDTVRGVLTMFCHVEIGSPFKNRVKIIPFPQKAGFDATNETLIFHTCFAGFLHSIHGLSVPQIPELHALLVVSIDLVTYAGHSVS